MLWIKMYKKRTTSTMLSKLIPVNNPRVSVITVAELHGVSGEIKWIFISILNIFKGFFDSLQDILSQSNQNLSTFLLNGPHFKML